MPPFILQVDAVLGDRRPTLEDIRALGFTTRCLNESMRLYPQPPVLIRRALEDDIVGGYRVGVRILAPVHGTSHAGAAHWCIDCAQGTVCSRRCLVTSTACGRQLLRGGFTDRTICRTAAQHALQHLKMPFHVTAFVVITLTAAYCLGFATGGEGRGHLHQRVEPAPVARVLGAPE